MNGWEIRFAGSTSVVNAPSATRVIEGIREGEWESTDLVRAQGTQQWMPIADHPQFADTVAELEEPLHEPHDETHLDMNPLIDVALVLLIFFILTTTYSSLRRTIDVPAEPDTPSQSQPKPTENDLRERTFTVTCWMEGEKPTIKIDEKIVDLKDLEKELVAHVKSSGKYEILLEVDGRVPWGIEASIHDASKAAEIQQIYRKPKKKT